VFVLDMGKPVKILDLAREMIKLSGFEPDVDIPIVYVGIRPGEKLFEELLSAEEGATATQSNKIFIAKLLPVNEKLIVEYLEKLGNAAGAAGNKQLVTDIFKQLIPRFSNNGGLSGK